MFDVETADFSGITGQRDVVASHALHKAFIDVTELGTEAGASTGKFPYIITQQVKEKNTEPT